MDAEATTPLDEGTDEGASHLLAEACEAAVDLAGEELPLGNASGLVLVFDPNGDIQVYSLDGDTVEFLLPALNEDGAQGVHGVTVAAADIERYMAEEAERGSTLPPPPPESKP